MKTARTILSCLTGLLLLSIWAEPSHAQLFGPRNIGRNARGRQLSTSNSVGTVTSDRRFVRGQRRADDFVGTDRSDAAGFVGSTQTINDGQVTSSVTGLREQPTRRVNRNRTISRSGLYPERLTPAFSVPDTPRAAARHVAGDDSVQLPALETIANRRGFRVSRVPTERSVVLSGTVPTERDRRIAEILASFEPGVETVTSDLEVAGSSAP